jgi:3'(2'), 5'-bisphosphate nucleotidase
MTTTNLTRELDLARTLAVEAGRLILEVYATEFDVVDKAAGAGPVTEADRRANTLLVRELRRAFPADGIIAEESADNSDARRFARCWYVDPLDGTREFVARNGEFAVHVGLAIGGEARLGVVYKPVDGKLYAGIVGDGCTLESAGKTSRLQVSTRSDQASLRLVVSRSNKSPQTDRIRALLGITDVRECGSVGVKAGLLAENLADVYLHASPRSSRWDSCAPEAVLRAAGGDLTDLFGARYRYDGAELENVRGLFGCNAAAAAVVQPAVLRVLAETPLRR